jgi:Pvc16 N-terminal domain
VPEWTPTQPWRRAGERATLDAMIEHADAALESWLATLQPNVDVTFERLDPEGSTSKSKHPLVSLLLHGVREQTDKRDNEVRDVRDRDGRVVERQRSTRFFELDYLCTVSGAHRDAHRAIGALIQLLVDHDVIPLSHVPTELADLGYPLDVHLVATTGFDVARASATSNAAALVIRLVLPVRPTSDREIAPPAVKLHLDMTPPPKRRGAAVIDVSSTTNASPDTRDPDRKWTTVRRRELIASPVNPPAPSKRSERSS